MFHLQRAAMRAGGMLCLACLLALLLPGPGAYADGSRAKASRGSVPQSDPRLGVSLDGVGDGGRGKPFVDLAKTLRPFTVAGDPKGTPAPADARGWPTVDAQTVLFDIRPVPAWNPPIDDPEAFQPDWSGVYHLSLHGQADLTAADAAATVSGQTYNPATNTTRAVLTVPKGLGLLVVSFTHTRRTAEASIGSGFTDLQIIRPGYPADTKQVFTSEFLAAVKPFGTLRFMDWLDTNANPGFYGDPGHHAALWADRRQPDDATQASDGTHHGVAWEYVIALANTTGKDAWINIPIAASDDYVTQLARLFKATLKPGLHIYIEDSNEVWNFGFPQYIYNKLAAEAEVAAGGSELSSGAETDHEVWAHRRHAQRLVQIARLFAQVYGSGALGTTLRPVYASWTINSQAFYADVLAWVARTYGPPRSIFYAVAQSHYFNAQKAAPDADAPALLAAMRADSDAGNGFTGQIGAVARQYGLKQFAYEGGSDTGGGSVVNVANRIRAERAPGMTPLIVHDVQDNWWARGGGLYIYFSLCGPYSRFGGWGLTDDIAHLDTAKYRAIRALVSSGLHSSSGLH